MQQGLCHVEKMQSWKWNEVRRHLSQTAATAVARKSQWRGRADHCLSDDVIQVVPVWLRLLQNALTDAVNGFVVECKNEISIFEQLMTAKSGVVGFARSLTDFRRWENRTRCQAVVRIDIPDFPGEQRAKTRPRATTQRMENQNPLNTFGRIDLCV